VAIPPEPPPQTRTPRAEGDDPPPPASPPTREHEPAELEHEPDEDAMSVDTSEGDAGYLPASEPPPPVLDERAVAAIERAARLGPIRSSASWLLWIAGLSVVNVVMTVAGTQWSFAMGLVLSQLIAVVGNILADGMAAPVVAWIGAWIAAVPALGLAVLYPFARDGRAWALALGTLAYAMDFALLLALMADSHDGVCSTFDHQSAREHLFPDAAHHRHGLSGDERLVDVQILARRVGAGVDQDGVPWDAVALLEEDAIPAHELTRDDAGVHAVPDDVRARAREIPERGDGPLGAPLLEEGDPDDEEHRDAHRDRLAQIAQRDVEPHEHEEQRDHRLADELADEAAQAAAAGGGELVRAVGCQARRGLRRRQTRRTSRGRLVLGADGVRLAGHEVASYRGTRDRSRRTVRNPCTVLRQRPSASVRCVLVPALMPRPISPSAAAPHRRRASGARGRGAGRRRPRDPRARGRPTGPS